MNIKDYPPSLNEDYLLLCFFFSNLRQNDPGMSLGTGRRRWLSGWQFHCFAIKVVCTEITKTRNENCHVIVIIQLTAS